MNTTSCEETKKIEELESIANNILELKNNLHQRRTIVIEFAGSPKSGKSSCINSLNLFLKRNGFKTKILNEKASICPISNKLSPNFNLWTFCQTLSEYLEYAMQHSEYDVILIDRGIFDALCWFDFLKDTLDTEETNTIINFIKLEKWRKFTDLVCVFKSTPETSLDREYKNLLTRKTGRIMKDTILNNYLESLDNTFQKYNNEFHYIESIDTSSLSQNEVNYTVTKNVLNELHNMLIEKIANYPNSIVSKLMNPEYNFLDLITEKVTFSRRDIVENEDKIQPIAIGVLIDRANNKILRLKKGNKSLESDSPEKDRYLLWAGGHIRKDDLTGQVYPYKDCTQNIDHKLFEKALERELKEELGIDIVIENNKQSDPILIYTPNSDKSKKHFAICYELKINSKDLSLTIDKYEFSNNKNVSFVNIDTLDLDDSFESWSIQIVKKILKKNINQEQVTYFG